MFLSKHKNGYYYIYYKDNLGKRRAISTKSKNKTDANKSLSNLSAELKERAEKKTVPISLKKMIFEFLKYSESVHSYNHTLSLKSTLKEMVNYIGDVPAEQIDKEKILNYFQYRGRKVSPYTLKRDIESLSSLFNWAMDHNFIIKNLCKGIKRPRLPEKLPVFLLNGNLRNCFYIQKVRILRMFLYLH